MSFSQYLRQLGQPIAYYPQLAKPLGGVTAAILFGQLFFWQDKTTNPLGVYKTQAELEQETGLSRREQETARKKLVELGILIETHKRLEHRIYFKLDLAKFDALMADIREATNPPFPNGTSEHSPMAESDIREATNPPFVNTEITTENTNNIPPISPQGEISSAAPKKSKKSTSAVKVDNPEQVALPDYVERATWVAYCQMRKAKGKATEIRTEATIQLCLRDLEKHSGGNPALAKAILEQSIKNCWTGIFALRAEAVSPSKSSKQPNPFDKSGSWAKGRTINVRAELLDENGNF